MRRGSCKLCDRDTDLLDSHLIPAAIYKRLKSPTSPNPNPLLIRSGSAVQTSRQTKTYLLCGDCEKLLNENGERQVLPLLANIDQTFPLYDLVTKVAPDTATDEVTAYAAARNPDIPVSALAHFALGIFWKASVHHWHGSDEDPLIELGPYQKKLGRFVREPLDEYFPENVALMVCVLPPFNIPISLSLPIRAPAGDGFRNFRFYVPGIQFVFSVGKCVERETCFCTNPLHPVWVQDIASAVNEIPRRMFQRGKDKKVLDRRIFGSGPSTKRRHP